jgi:hypothetical protein
MVACLPLVNRCSTRATAPARTTARRRDLTKDAERLVALLARLVPTEPEVLGLITAPLACLPGSNTSTTTIPPWHEKPAPQLHETKGRPPPPLNPGT